jgi:hypothetical protein
MVNSQVQPEGNSIMGTIIESSGQCRDICVDANGRQGSRRSLELRLDILAETQAVAVTVLDVEITATVRLVSYIASNADSFPSELGMKAVGVIDPDIGIPSLPLRIHPAVRAAYTGYLEWLSMMITPFRQTMQKQGGSPQKRS